MPIKNVPIVHKFGIISHSQRLELQERLARKVLEEGTSNPVFINRKQPYGIDEDFVNEFNSVESESEQQLDLEKRAQQIYLRAKRKAGLRNGGIGNHVDLQQAWKDLALLATCESRKFQEGALNSLYESLYFSPISQSHVESLLQLAENSIRWLTRTGMEGPYLRTGELKLLKVSHLVFTRLYYHHLATDIVGFHTERTQIVDLLQGFQEHQDTYRPFPASLLLVRVIMKIGALLKTGLEAELADLIENSSKLNGSENEAIDQLEATSAEESVFHEVETDHQEQRFIKTIPNIHDTSPTLWHCLELWRIVTHSNQSPDDAINELMNCSLEIYNEPMVDCVLSLHVLAEVAKLNSSALQALQYLARRDVLISSHDVRRGAHHHEKCDPFTLELTQKRSSIHTGPQEIEYSLDYVPSVLNSLKDFLNPRPIGEGEHENADHAKREGVEVEKFKEISRNAKFQEISRNNSRKSIDKIEEDESCDCSEPRSSISDGSLADVSSLASSQSHNETKTRSSKRRTRRRAIEHDNEDLSDESEDDNMEATARYDAPRKRKELLTRESTVSIGMQVSKARQPGSSCTITRPNTSIEALTRWSWELIVTYVRCLGEICMNGSKSQIQRDALVGCKTENAGLLQMLKYQLTNALENSDWSWRVRHVAVQEMIKICHNNNDNPNKEGLQNAAWSALLSHHSVEQDRRVLEAYKIARTEVNLGDKADNGKIGPDCRKVSLYSRICTNLSIIHTTPLEEDLTGSDVTRRSPGNQRVLRNEESLEDQRLTNSLRDLGSPRRHGLQGSMSSSTGHSSTKDQGSSKFHRSPKGQRSLQDQLSQRRKKNQQKMGRASLRDEILIATALDQKPDPYVKRSWFNVQDVVEDQWRKELSEEHDVIERQKQQNTDREMEQLRKSIGKKLLTDS